MENIIFESHKILKSEKNSLAVVEPILFDLKEQLHIQDEKFYNIMIAVTEAVNNAINHGNKLNANKVVHFDVYASKTGIEIVVKDQGEGFNPKEVADCLEPENLLKSSGRGVFIINELMDYAEIESSSEGTTITMRYGWG